MVEEFAISLFAQHLGTAYPISPKKLDQAFAAATSAQVGSAVPADRPPSPSKTSPSPTQNPAPKNQNPPTKTAPDRPTQADLNSLKNLFK